MASAASALLTGLPKSRSSIPASEHPGATTATHAAQNVDSGEAKDNPDFVHPEHVIRPRSYSGVEDLIIVCGHAIFAPFLLDATDAGLPLHSPHNESNWLLSPFQKSNPETGKPGEHETFLAHFKAGLDALTLGTDGEHPPSSLLIISGGATKRPQTDLSEARSYYHAALADELRAGHFHGGRTHHMFKRGYLLLEEHATDSFQNLLFSIALFRKTTGVYPSRIRVITHAFKAKRFLDLHAPAIRWPKDRIQVQGIDPVMTSVDLDNTLHGEEIYGYAPWKKDPFGTGETLSRKRAQRGWIETNIEFLVTGLEKSFKDLFRGKISESLPWEFPEVTVDEETAEP